MDRRLLRTILISASVIFIIMIGFVFYPKNEGYSLVKVASIDRILNVGNNIAYVGDKQILSIPTKSTGPSPNVIESNVVSSYDSPNSNKAFYTTNNNDQLKSYILDFATGSKNEYSQYDGFLWQNNEPRFLSNTNGKTNIVDGQSRVLYSNLNYQDYISYGDIILGKQKVDDVDLLDGIYDLINTGISSFKSMDISNIKTGTGTWSNGKYLMYLNNDDKFTTVNKDGNKNTYDLLVTQSQITSTNNDKEYIITFEGNSANIKSINLANGKITKIKNLDKQTIKNKYGIELEKIGQIFYSNNILYIVANKQLMKVNL